jgi:hypothetical protein
MGTMEMPALMHASAAFSRSSLMAGPLLPLHKSAQVGHVVHGPRADLDGGQLASEAQVVHGLGTDSAQQPAGLTLRHKQRGKGFSGAYGQDVTKEDIFYYVYGVFNNCEEDLTIGDPQSPVRVRFEQCKRPEYLLPTKTLAEFVRDDHSSDRNEPREYSRDHANRHNSYAYHIGGLEQLLGYMTGRASGYLLNYVRKKNILNLVKTLRDEMDQKLPCDQSGTCTDHTLKWSFSSLHAHSSGEQVKVFHIGFNMFAD